MALWYDEEHDGKVRFGLKTTRTLFMGQSPYQRVSVIETEAFGKGLLLDDLWMAVEGHDDWVYHEMLVHPALTTAPRIERVLIIGGGDGGTAREVLRHPEVRHVDMVEIDGMVVDAAKEHLPHGQAAWNDPRLTVRIQDGIEFVAQAEAESYDVVLIDGSDPVGPAEGLFNAAFFGHCKRVLRPGGVLATQSESPRLQRDVHIAMVNVLAEVFGEAHPYYGTVTIYPGGAWSWTYASKPGTDGAHTAPLAIHEARAAHVESFAEVYNREVHRGAFAVPNNLKAHFAPK